MPKGVYARKNGVDYSKHPGGWTRHDCPDCLSKRRQHWNKWANKNKAHVREYSKLFARKSYAKQPEKHRASSLRALHKKLETQEGKDAHADSRFLERFDRLNPNASADERQAGLTALHEKRWLRRARKAYHKTTKLLIDRGILAGESTEKRRRRTHASSKDAL